MTTSTPSTTAPTRAELRDAATAWRTRTGRVPAVDRVLMRLGAALVVRAQRHAHRVAAAADAIAAQQDEAAHHGLAFEHDAHPGMFR